MSIYMDRIYCAEQIEVPPKLPDILKAYTKEVIRFAPADIPAFSRDYFAALADGSLKSWLEHQAQAAAAAKKTTPAAQAPSAAAAR